MFQSTHATSLKARAYAGLATFALIVRTLMGVAAVFLGTAYVQPVMAMTDARFTEQLVRLPVHTPAGNVELETTLYLPPGEGPFPVLVMNHGKARGNPRDQERDRRRERRAERSREPVEV